jgi:pilus assembly protein CpaB
MRTNQLIAIALILGAIASFFVAQSLGVGAQKSEHPRLAAAVKQINPGEVISSQDVRLIEWHGPYVPAGAFLDIKQLENRVAKQSIYPDELVLEPKLASADSRGGLASTIAFGKRAITVRVNDVIAVAGFAFPGSFVDVLVSAKDANGNPFAKIVLNRVKVLAVEQETLADFSKPKVVNAVTLELTPQESEKLDLARSIGTLTLVLRNELDEESVVPSTARLEDITDPGRLPDAARSTALPSTETLNPTRSASKPRVEQAWKNNKVIEIRGIREHESEVF